jgi:hypothetical protein
VHQRMLKPPSEVVAQDNKHIKSCCCMDQVGARTWLGSSGRSGPASAYEVLLLRVGAAGQQHAPAVDNSAAVTFTLRARRATPT